MLAAPSFFPPADTTPPFFKSRFKACVGGSIYQWLSGASDLPSCPSMETCTSAATHALRSSDVRPTGERHKLQHRIATLEYRIRKRLRHGIMALAKPRRLSRLAAVARQPGAPKNQNSAHAKSGCEGFNQGSVGGECWFLVRTVSWNAIAQISRNLGTLRV